MKRDIAAGQRWRLPDGMVWDIRGEGRARSKHRYFIVSDGEREWIVGAIRLRRLLEAGELLLAAEVAG